MNNKGSNLLQLVAAVFVMLMTALALGTILHVSYSASPAKASQPAYVSAPLLQSIYNAAPASAHAEVERRDPNPQPPPGVQWSGNMVLTKDPSKRDSDVTQIWNCELGFRADGVIIWRQRPDWKMQ